MHEDLHPGVSREKRRGGAALENVAGQKEEAQPREFAADGRCRVQAGIANGQ
jgi:hypothetical protein